MLSSPSQYASLISSIREHGGTSPDDRLNLAAAAFERCGQYDQLISAYLKKADKPSTEAAVFPQDLVLQFSLRGPLRYGENPHQDAAFYVEPAARGPNLATARLLHGKELSYNNLLDLDSALRLVRSFALPAACILKHNNPCGAAVDNVSAAAFERAYEGDPVSAFGGIVALNRPVDLASAERMCQPGRFIEAILAPGFDQQARA